MVLEVFAGSGLGLLVGYLLGLSVSQVVGGVVAALSALLGAFLGLQPGAASADAAPQARGRAARTGAFGLFCVIGITLGLAVRSGSLLAPSVKADVQDWVTAGYAPAEAQAYVAFARLGLQPKGAELASGAAGEAAVNAHTNTLFAAATRSACNDVDGLATIDDKLAALRAHGGSFAALAQAIAQAPDRAAALARAMKQLCG
jgi:hypothetical protein